MNLHLTPGGRIYCPELGRFLQPDPHAPPGTNPYTYVGGEPPLRVDPRGLDVVRAGPLPTPPSPANPSNPIIPPSSDGSFETQIRSWFGGSNRYVNDLVERAKSGDKKAYGEFERYARGNLPLSPPSSEVDIEELVKYALEQFEQAVASVRTMDHPSSDDSVDTPQEIPVGSSSPALGGRLPPGVTMRPAPPEMQTWMDGANPKLIKADRGMGPCMMMCPRKEPTTSIVDLVPYTFTVSPDQRTVRVVAGPEDGSVIKVHTMWFECRSTVLSGESAGFITGSMDCHDFAVPKHPGDEEWYMLRFYVMVEFCGDDGQVHAALFYYNNSAVKGKVESNTFAKPMRIEVQ